MSGLSIHARHDQLTYRLTYHLHLIYLDEYTSHMAKFDQMIQSMINQIDLSL